MSDNETVEEIKEYKNRKRTCCLKNKTWKSIVIWFAVICSFAAFGMSIYNVWQIDQNIINDIEILEGSKRSMDEDYDEHDMRAVANGGMILQRKGKKIQITTTQVGLAVQKRTIPSRRSTLYVINSGAVAVEAGPGMDITSTPIFKRDVNEKSEEDNEYNDNDAENPERATLISGKTYKINSASVLRVESRLAKKREDEESERGVITPSSTGIDVLGSDQEPNIINTGVLTLTADTGLVNTGSSQDIVLRVSNPVIFATVTVSFSELASGASKVLYTASSGTATYRIIDIVSVVTGGVNFTGGDRVIDIGTAAQQKWYISANAASTTGTTSLVTSVDNTGIQASSTTNAITDTAAGANIVAKYSGGTTDYTAGTVSLTLMLIQTAY